MNKIIRGAALSLAIAAASLGGVAATAPAAEAGQGYNRPQWCKYHRNVWWTPKHIVIRGSYWSNSHPNRQCANNGIRPSYYHLESWGWQ